MWERHFESLVNLLADAAESGKKLIADLAIPPTCLMCEAIVEERGGCCSGCWRKLHFIGPPICEITGTPFAFDHGEGAISPEAIARPPPYRRCRSAVVYDEDARRLVTTLKYGDRQELAPWMARWMSQAGSSLIADNHVVVPVPLHSLRLLGRRFNQSAELARHVCKLNGLRYAPTVLVRHRRTLRQVGLNRKQRERNLQGAFRVPDDQRHKVAGFPFLLIDDVITSGATVEAAVRALKRAGAGPVDVLTFARAGVIEA